MIYWIKVDVKQGRPFCVKVEAGNLFQACAAALHRLRREGVEPHDVVHLGSVARPSIRGARVIT